MFTTQFTSVDKHNLGSTEVVQEQYYNEPEILDP